IPRISPQHAEKLGNFATAAWRLARSVDTATETSHAFHVPALHQVAGSSLVERAAAWERYATNIQAELAQIDDAINDLCFLVYGIDEADRHRLKYDFAKDSYEVENSHDIEARYDDDAEAEAMETGTFSLTAALLSWTLGTTFGRYDLRLTTGEKFVSNE